MILQSQAKMTSKRETDDAAFGRYFWLLKEF